MVTRPEHPLSRLRVVDLAHGDADLTTRFWADLGADVVKVEPPVTGQAPAPAAGDHDLRYSLHNANKRVLTLDSADPAHRQQLVNLIADADIVVDSGNPGRAAAYGISIAGLGDRHPHLITLWINDFGSEGPKSTWRATDAVLYALSTALSRSRTGDRVPVLPPDGIATATAAAQAAWAGLVAYYRRLRGGQGDHIDFSRWEAVLQSLDPPFGSQGQAAAARGGNAPRSRPGRRQDPYPIFACRDGWVRLCILAPRQWHGLRAWLGEPEEFQDPTYDAIGARFAAFDRIGALVSALFSTQTTADVVAAGDRFGVPTAALAAPTDTLRTEHFRNTGTFVGLEIAPGLQTDVPDAAFRIDGERTGIRSAATRCHDPRWLDRPLESTHRDPPPHRPFEGLRVLDLGVIVAGGELGRLFSDLGADVIKVENPAYPDGLRQARPGQAISESFAWTHRNQSSFGVNLREPKGAEIFAQLVTEADAVLANFKPGTLAALGFPPQRLAMLNPRVVLAESSAYGDRGPWSHRMGYGPLVRASTGVTALWRDDDAEFCDTTTVFPDHVVARVTAIGALALLIRRERDGRGGHVHVSQADVAISQLGIVYAAESAKADGLAVTADGTRHTVLPASGEDQWCVVSIRDDDDRAAVASVLAAAGRESLQQWLVGQDCHAAASVLQAQGVPAAPMYRAGDVLTDTHLRHRNAYTDMAHPLLDVPLPSETAPARFVDIPPAPLLPAPLPGEHTRSIGRRLLGMSDTDIDRLVADGVLTEAPVMATLPRES